MNKERYYTTLETGVIYGTMFHPIQSNCFLNLALQTNTHIHTYIYPTILVYRMDYHPQYSDMEGSFDSKLHVSTLA